MNSSFNSYLESPVGTIKITADQNGILEIHFIKDEIVEQANENNISKNCKQQLMEYFISERKEFDVPLNFSGTNFQHKVWMQLQTIPFGKTTSYLQMAKNLGDVKCIRAAASANGKNPFAIVVPCHRVIGTDGTLTGYAGGLWRKQWLLEHENKIANGVTNLFD